MGLVGDARVSFAFCLGLVTNGAKPSMLTNLLEECYISFSKAHGMFTKKNESKIPGKPLLAPLVTKPKQKANDTLASPTSPIENKALWKQSCARVKTANNKNQPIMDRHNEKCQSLAHLNQDSQHSGRS
jgi:hypothetical protein